jgi:PAS domain S-box-containing protein
VLESLVGTVLPPFITFYPMVMLAALYGGLSAGLLATVISALLVSLFSLPPAGIAVTHLADQVSLALFCGINLTVSLICGALRAARGRTFAEARRAEASEERFRLFMDNTPTPAWIKDDQGRYVYVNKAYETRFGVRLANCQGKTDHQLWPPDVATRLQQADRAALDAGHPIEVTEDTTEPNGNRSCWLNSKFPYKDALNRQYVASLGLDITPQKREEEALREQARYNRLRADAATALQQTGALNDLLQNFATLLVEHLQAAFARIWTYNAATQTLELQASAGLYTHINGAHARVPLGHLKIGRIAQLRQPMISNQVLGDLHIQDQDWARREALVAFAGFPLILDDRLLGVVALFARQTLPLPAVETFGALASILAQALGRKQAQEALVREKEFSDHAINSLPGVFYVVDPQNRLRRWNRNLEALSGYSAEEILQMVVFDFIAPEDRQAVAEAIAKVYATGESSAEVLTLTKTGSKILFAFTSRRLDLSGQTGFLGVGVDVTERRRFEQTVRESEARLRLAVDTAELGMYERDMTTGELQMNDTCKAIMGVRDRPFSSNIARRSVHPEDKERVFAAVARAFDPTLREVCAAEFRILRPDSTVRWVAGRGRVIFDNRSAPPQPLRFLGVLHDITQRKQAEAALCQARDELARANQALEIKVRERTAKLEEAMAELEHFSYTITHDMRAPLRAITGYAKMLTTAHAHCLPREASDLLRRISDSALRMDHLITDSLQYSRVVREQLQLQPIEPAPLIRGIIESYPQFQPPHAEITIAPGLPRVLANEAALTQVFSNLLGNAVKFMPYGQVPRVTITAEPRGGFVRLWFTDNGIGIPEEYHERIWHMFQRLSKTYEGTGIGLALVQKVVERMGGQVGVESASGQGSRFWVELRPAS